MINTMEVGNRQRAFDWHYEIWPWMTFELSYFEIIKIIISKTVTDTTMASMKVEQETTHLPQIGTMTFDLG